MSRPNISCSIEELETMFRQHQGNMAKLKELAAELQHRGTARAHRLGQKVAARLAALKDPEAQKTSGADDHAILRSELAKSRQEIDRLRGENRALAAALSAAQARDARRSPPEEGRIQDMLTVIKTLKKTVQRSYHPDQCVNMTISEANKCFVNVMSVFDMIEKF